MHIHTTAATPAGDSLAGFQGARTAEALRRARELSDASARLKARNLTGGIEEDSASFASLMGLSPLAQGDSLSQAVASVVGRLPEQSEFANSAGDLSQRNSASAGSSSAAAKSAVAPGLGVAGPYAEDEPASLFRQTSAAESVGTSRASPWASGSGGSNPGNPNEWLRPVSFWA